MFVNSIDASVPEFADQYQKIIEFSTGISTSTAQILTVPVPVPVLRILSENNAKFQFFEEIINFHAGNSNFMEQF